MPNSFDIYIQSYTNAQADALLATKQNLGAGTDGAFFALNSSFDGYVFIIVTNGLITAIIPV